MLTLRLTDSPINQCGQGGLMRLVISLIPVVEKKIKRTGGKKKTLFLFLPNNKRCFRVGDNGVHAALILVHLNLF